MHIKSNKNVQHHDNDVTFVLKVYINNRWHLFLLNYSFLPVQLDIARTSSYMLSMLLVCFILFYFLWGGGGFIVMGSVWLLGFACILYHV